MATLKEFNGLVIMVADALIHQWVVGISGESGRLDLLENDVEDALVFRTKDTSEILNVWWDAKQCVLPMRNSGNGRVAVAAVVENGKKAWRVLTERNNGSAFVSVEADQLDSELREYMASERFQEMQALFDKFNQGSYEYKAAS